MPKKKQCRGRKNEKKKKTERECSGGVCGG